MKTIEAELPDKLYDQVKLLISEGWFKDEKELICEALRRYLEAHRPDIMKEFIMEDVNWGLYGKE